MYVCFPITTFYIDNYILGKYHTLNYLIVESNPNNSLLILYVSYMCNCMLVDYIMSKLKLSINKCYQKFWLTCFRYYVYAIFAWITCITMSTYKYIHMCMYLSTILEIHITSNKTTTTALV